MTTQKEIYSDYTKRM